MTVIVFGSVNMDMVTRVDRLPLPGETVAAARVDYLPGGKGSNQAVAAARFGHDTRLIAAVGEDAYGDQLIAFLKGEGIDPGHIRRVPGSTGLALINVASDGENQIVLIAGANAALTCPATLPAVTAERPVFLAQFEAPVHEVGAFLRAGRDAGARTILNAAPALLQARPLLALADILIVNETELALFCDAAPQDDPDAVVALARLLVGNAGWVVVTLGGKGMVAVSAVETIRLSARKACVVDTTGAGDTFCGVLAASIAEGLAMADALEIAVAAASLSVEREGAASSMPRREEVFARLAPAA
jgi:ribokinase